mmetsp:Transcript_4248/g.6100  ORF Transcript_4248/g.6100 Transcript_4248/m.6100 type:complete len:262 (-) Transcript_4248:225-1010(-)
MTEEQHGDLSPYELLRLEKIRRNNARLKALGFGSAIVTPNKPPKKAQSKKRSRNNTATNRSKNVVKKQPTRSSKRLRGEQADVYEITDDADTAKASTANHDNLVDNENEGEAIIDYTFLAKEPDQLDDFEFQVYANLRAWRLQRKNELEVEPYKICQNHTLCELIRRVRNDPTWGALIILDENNVKRSRSEEDVANDLIQCWGLGPSKVKADGFGPEMMGVIEEETNVKLLDSSRAINDNQQIEKDGNISSETYLSSRVTN